MHTLRWTLGCVLLLLAATPSQAAPPAAPQKNWRQLTTPNFRVIGNAGEGDLRRAATRLEQFREALGILFPKAILVTSTPTTVIVFRGNREYEPFKPLYNGKPKDIAGYFLPGRTANYVTMAATGIEEFGNIVYHEYVHLVVNNNVEGTPVWFNEGLAEYYATFEVTPNGRLASLGKIQSRHVLRLREQWMPLAALIAAGHDSPYYNERDKVSVFYAESWALVHYLLLGADGKYRSTTGSFVADLANGVPLEQACQKAFNVTPVALERELRRYVEADRFFQQQVKFTARIGDIERVPVTALDEAVVHATLADLLFRMQRQEEARAEADAALTLAPELPDAHAMLGRILITSNHHDEAMPHLAKAAAAADAPWASHYEYALLLIEARQPGASARDAEIDRALQRTIELQPTFPDAYVQLGWLRSQSADGADEALRLVKHALDLSPGNEQYWLMLAGLYTTASDYASARVIAGRLASSAKDEQVRNQAATLLAETTRILEIARQSPVQRTNGARAVMPLFRKLGPGEDHVAGLLTEIRCTSSSQPVTFVVTAHGSATTYETPSFDAVEFITYRPDLSGRIMCGAQSSPAVIVTFTRGEDGHPPRAVAIEFLPDGYEPK